MNESNEVPTYQPPEGVHGPTLGRDLPDGCERLGASLVPSSDEWWSSPVVSADTLYWWRFPPLTASQEARSILAPAPPWPGAVLSGLVDEDGEPTWLAQAPNVQGEAVRTCIDFPWFICGSDNAVTPYWVEVRAPRAVPEPETERVPVLDAIRDRIELTHPEGEFLAVGVELREDGDLVAIEQQEPWGKAQPVAPDGTVEVLRDGGR